MSALCLLLRRLPFAVIKCEREGPRGCTSSRLGTLEREFGDDFALWIVALEKAEPWSSEMASSVSAIKMTL
ncbi:hypothetical protein CEXT_573621 [Caerostris extrusa]|uniref:Secreted protein n=1 Tax=Caerostris extrusa TaxID=172846 RepID=A0AAV4S991_CAEEX|nr:hypothetical protein CEXT_573621 [Caerostris extrusa]